MSQEYLTEVSTALPRDARFLAALDVAMVAEQEAIPTETLQARRAYWVDRLSNVNGCEHTFVARIGGLYAGYMALHDDQQPPDLVMSAHFRNTDSEAQLMKKSGVDLQNVEHVS